MAIGDMNRLRDAPADEYYTLYKDIDKELSRYARQLAGKRIYLPCDGPQSMFVKWFKDHPELRCKVTHTSDDYRKPSNIKRMKEADIVITNPPFSLCAQDREKGIPFIPLLLSLGVRFLIICSELQICKSKILPYYDKGRIHFGYNKVNLFRMPNGQLKNIQHCYWFTNLRGGRPYKTITYSKKPLSAYPRDIKSGVIVVDSVKDIPRANTMLVPYTSLQYFPPSNWSLSTHYHTEVKEMGKITERFGRILVKRRKRP